MDWTSDILHRTANGGLDGWVIDFDGSVYHVGFGGHSQWVKDHYPRSSDFFLDNGGIKITRNYNDNRVYSEGGNGSESSLNKMENFILTELSDFDGIINIDSRYETTTQEVKEHGIRGRL